MFPACFWAFTVVKSKKTKERCGDMTKVMLAMSGGVDSSVAAYLLQKAGFDCIGATMILCDSAAAGSVDDAKAVARTLNIPFYAFDHTKDFHERVIGDFIRCYEAGGTPNPCVTCNKSIKFDVLLDRAIHMGCEYLATGHYAQIRQGENGRFLLYKAADLQKDQSYFLACLNQYQLSHCKFPLGELTKEQVRQIAQELSFVTAKKKDSQDICFIPDGDYKTFMERYTGKIYPQGNYLDMAGKVVGTHQGAVGYTIGQRKGLGIALGKPAYVTRKDMAQNTVTLGRDEDLYKSVLTANNWNFIAFDSLKEPLKVKARVRYRHTEQPATVFPMENGFAKVVFDEPQRAITAGQAVVLYDGDMVVGSGTIQEIL